MRRVASNEDFRAAVVTSPLHSLRGNECYCGIEPVRSSVAQWLFAFMAGNVCGDSNGISCVPFLVVVVHSQPAIQLPWNP
jgi:hypothetical protein